MADEASTILTNLLSILRAVARFTTTNFTSTQVVTDGDYRILDQGVDEAAVLSVGTFSLDGQAQNRQEWTHTILIDLFERDKSDGQVLTSFRSLRGAVLDALRQYPQLNNPAVYVTGFDWSAEADPENGKTVGGAPFVGQELRARYTIEVTVTGGDFA
jgi:hypothetical protein